MRVVAVERYAAAIEPLSVHALRVEPAFVARRVRLSNRELNGWLCRPDTVVLSLITQAANGAIESAMHIART